MPQHRLTADGSAVRDGCADASIGDGAVGQLAGRRSAGDLAGAAALGVSAARVGALRAADLPCTSDRGMAKVAVSTCTEGSADAAADRQPLRATQGTARGCPLTASWAGEGPAHAASIGADLSQKAAVATPAGVN